MMRFGRFPTFGIKERVKIMPDLEVYKEEVRKCLTRALPLAETEYVEERMKLYEDEFPQFLKDEWTPAGVAAVLIMGG